MALPDPQLGLVISYSYLWHHEHNAGRDEGTKSRPCVVVLAMENACRARDPGVTTRSVQNCTLSASAWVQQQRNRKFA